MGAHPPRIPPTGFFGVGARPMCAGASSRSTALDDNSLFCAVREACRAIKVQLRVVIEAITQADTGLLFGYLGHYFTARAPASRRLVHQQNKLLLFVDFKTRN